jgi:hypothetical protein
MTGVQFPAEDIFFFLAPYPDWFLSNWYQGPFFGDEVAYA